MKTLDDLRAFYETDLKARMDALEQRRRRAVTNGSIAVAVLGIVGFVVGVMMASAGGPLCMIIPIIVGLVIGAALLFGLSAGNRREFKNTIVRGVIEFMEPDLRYFPEEGIGKVQFRASDLFQQHIDRYRCEDLVKGRVGQTEVMFSEVHAEYKTTSGTGKNRRTHWHTIFKGLFFIGDFHKDFHGRTVVLPDRAQKLFGGLGQALQSLNFTRGKLIKLEDPEFEREFVVYGDDQIEARYILSPAMMERITAFGRNRNTSVYLSFVGSQVYAAFSTKKNLFEPKLFGHANFDTLVEYVAEIRLATDIVEELNLNTRIWSKS